MSDQDWRSRGTLFDTAAEGYADGRPGYPDAVFDLLSERYGLVPGAQVLEIGPGAGQATLFGDPERVDPLQHRLPPLLLAKAPQVIGEGGSASAYALDASARTAEARTAPALGEVQQHVIPWTGEHDADSTRALFSTFSPFLALPEALREELLDDIHGIVQDDMGGHVNRPYLTVMYAWQRTA